MIAITCLLPFNYLNNKIEGVETELLDAGPLLAATTSAGGGL